MAPLRYGHSEGHTDVCYTDSGESIITCGSEGDVRVWSGVDDTDQKDVCIGEQAWAVCQKRTNMYVATDTNLVQAFTFPELDIDGIITRFRAPVTQIDVSPDGQTLAAGSCDMEIHVVDLSSMSSQSFIGHKAPVRSVSLDPHLDYLASAGCDGAAVIWQLKSGEIVKKWDFLDKSNAFESLTCICRLHFQPSGRHLAIPVGKSIKLFERDSWNQIYSLSIESNNSPFSVVRFSKCNKYLAGGTEKGDIFIWNISNEKVLNKYTAERDSPITSIAWHPRSTGIVFCNKNGQLGDLDSLIDTAGHRKLEEIDIAEDVAGIPLGEPFFEDEDDDNENVISLKKIKAESGFGENQSDTKSEKDEEESIAEPIKTEPQIPITELQDPFQPSSSPSHLQQRYMVWNNTGIVRQFDTEDLDEIDVEFHDTAVHHGFRMGNTQGYTMATLTQQVLVLASPRKSDNSSRVHCIMLKAWDAQKEWEVSLKCEEVIAVAAGFGWISVVTDLNMVHIFSIDGTQTDIFSLPGPLITLTGAGTYLSLFFYSAQGVENDHFISYLKVFIDPGNKLASQVSLQPLSLTPKSKLNWVGHSDEGSLSTLDSEGVLRIYYNKIWRPICCLEDRPKGKFDHYFVTGLSERTYTIRCILCKGSYYPLVVPKPLLSEIEWQIPLFELDTEKGKLEKEMLKFMITLPHLDMLGDAEECEEAKKAAEKSISVAVMKLFALACQSGLEGRAVNLCHSMPNVEVVRLASKYAAKMGRHQLAERVSKVAADMDQTRLKATECRRVEEEVPSYGFSERLVDEGSQDMFSDSEPASRREKENLIIMMKKKKCEALAPNPPRLIKKNNNPFKKSTPLPCDITDKEPRISYIDWYKENLPKLRKEHPLMKDSELTTVGLKKYRQDMEKAEKDNCTLPLENVNNLSPKKALQEKESLSDSMDVVAATPDDSIVTKKRKSNDSDVRVKKKASSSAALKLKSFSFSKKS